LLDEEDTDTSSGVQIAGHEIVEEIARGAMGIVYEARDHESARIVALKMLLPHIAERSGMRERFRIEARACARLEHPAILPVYSVGAGDSGELPYMTMKIAEGGTLADRREKLRGNWRGVAELLATLSEAVHFAHSQGVIHRDIKPGNVLFDGDGNPYLSDFGLAKLIDTDSQLTMTVQFLGTPHYVAPEIASSNAGAASVASDIWGLGAVLHELLLGKPPFDGDSMPALLRSIVDSTPLLTSSTGTAAGVPRDLRIICLKCLSKLPKDRFSSANDLAYDLRAWLDKRPILARPPGIVERIWFRARRNPLLSTMVVVLGLAIAFIGVQFWLDARHTRQALAESLLAEARLERQTGRFDRRDAALDLIERAIAIQRTPELRDELISILAWPHLELRTLVEDDDLVDATYSLSSRRIAVVKGEAIEIRDLETGEMISETPLDPAAYHIVGPFTPDDRYLIVRLTDRMQLRDVTTGEVVLSVPGKRFSLTFDEAGKQMAYAVTMGNIQMLQLDRTPPVVRDLGPLTYRLIPKAFSPDGQTLAVKREYTRANSLSLIHSTTGVPVRGVDVPRAGNTQRAVFDPNGSHFYAGFSGGNIHRYPLRETLPARVFSGHSDKVTWVGLIGNGRVLVSQSEDETTRLWDTATAEPLAVLPWSGGYHGAPGTLGNRFFLRRGDELVEGELVPSEICTTIALPDPDPDYAAASGKWLMKMSPDGKRLAVSAQQNLHMIETDSWTISQSFTMPAVFDLEYAAETGILLAGRTQSVFQYLPTGEKSVREVKFRHPVRRGSHVGWAGADRGVAISWSGKGIVFDGGLHSPAETILKDETIEALSVNPSGSTLVCATPHRIVTYDLAGDQVKKRREIPESGSVELAISEDGKRAITGGSEEYSCWDLDTGERQWSLPHQLHSKIYRPISWAQKAGLVAVGLDDFSVSLVDPDSGKVLARLEHPNQHRVGDVAVSPDGQHVAVVTVGRLVKIWHLTSLARELEARGFTPSFLPRPAP